MTTIYVQVVVEIHGEGEAAEEQARTVVSQALSAAGILHRHVQATRFEPSGVQVSYEPQAIRDHFDDDPRLEEVSDERLYNEALAILGDSDEIWKQFHNNCREILTTLVPEKKEE